ncbi:MFS transporter [uncultured Bradyrhizobium sp.]|uniref:MFS transporter n=1 Tax=uncultured Bradyrhizobium sp. TaxID=199684 RepID=UPI00261207B3|nr:MFS transporter [uncultured Bradyrhizobium sp.]
MDQEVNPALTQADDLVALTARDVARGAEPLASEKPAWLAVAAMMLGVTALLTAEFLPSGLLTPMARDLGVSPGLAGQAVTTTSLAGLVGALFTPTLTRSFNRKPVLLSFAILLAISNLLVALAPNITFLLTARIVLGLALGGFWAMAAATTIRLVPTALVPRALSIVMSGVPAAMIIAVPLGSYLGEVMSWRAVFLLATAFAGIVFVVQALVLPRLAPRGAAGFGTLIEILQRPGIGAGILAATLVFTGHFGYFGYIRPFLENVTGLSAAGVAATLLAFGVANYLGSFVSGFLAERKLKLTMIAMPFLIGLVGLLLAAYGKDVVPALVLVALWGFAFSGVPVATTTWITRMVPDETESGTGMTVASIFLGITTGAAGGGLVLDVMGAPAVFVAGAIPLLLAVLLIATKVRTRPS